MGLVNASDFHLVIGRREVTVTIQQEERVFGAGIPPAAPRKENVKAPFNPRLAGEDAGIWRVAKAEETMSKIRQPGQVARIVSLASCRSRGIAGSPGGLQHLDLLRAKGRFWIHK